MSLSAEQLDGNQYLARALARIEASHQRIERLERVEAAARAFVNFLSANAGTNADWPVEIKVDATVAEPLLLSINALDRALATPRIQPEQQAELKATPNSELFSLPTDTALDRPTILAIRLRVVAMYEELESYLAKGAEDGEESIHTGWRQQVLGMKKVRQMLGHILDQQAGIFPSDNHVKPTI